MSFPKTLPTARIRPVMQAPPLRWGILGSGWIADKFVESVKAHTRQDIAAVGSRLRASAQAFAARWDISGVYDSYEALVTADDIDIIYVASPHNMHCDHALLAIEAGKHVLVEKPMALNFAQAQSMVTAARLKGVFLAEALWTYFLPKFDVLQQVLDAGAIGEIRSVYTEYGEYLPRDHRIFDANLAGGPLLDLGTYPVSLLTKLLGVPDKVVGLGEADPAGVNGQLSVVLANASGALGTMSTTLYGFTSTNAAIVGTKGSIRFDSEFHLPGPFEVWSLDGLVRLRYEEPRGAHFEGLFYEAADVAWAISEGRSESTCRPRQETLATMETLDCIRTAINISFAQAGLVE
ncbi:Gfo/Idh/MocA family oxidoreductase [Rhizobium sp. Leaf262]|uniref:Gfo/Idh/MocA family protein n=1 Tax=Rhizobium sp. Leaf262 TaxID=1736312 RepID=UPI0007854E48|nr:Gfo/Idh/MocA family oxidoreductase [Rhizobium sp. Leaf262]